MKITALIAGQSLVVIGFSFKQSATSDFSTVQNVLTLTIIDNEEIIFNGNTCDFYVNDNLIYSGLVTDFTEDTIRVESNSAISTDVVNAEHTIFYNKAQIRTELNFDIEPYKNLVTPELDVIVNSVTHYYSDTYYSEVRYGEG